MENQNSGESSGPILNIEKDNSTLMGVLSYLGILIIIPFLMAKNKPFVKFHLKQGLVLIVIEIILWVAMKMFWPIHQLISLLELGVLILIIIGIINVVQRKEKELPLVGSFSKHINI